jgi:hypothetical protein
MDRKLTERHLALAQRHSANGQIRIERQQSIIAKMQRAGHNIALAERLLGVMMTSQSHHEEHRDRLLNLLG